MTAPNPSVSLREHVVPIKAETHVVAVRWLKQALVLGLADGRVLRWRDGATDIVEAHAGGILCATGDKDRLISGGDDGRVVATGAEGEPEELAKDPKRRWIDAITLSAGGNLAWNTGKTVHARDEKGRIRTLEAASTPQGLVFAPKGYRLAIAQMNGVSLWYPNTEAKPEFLEWKGSHLDVAWSPDGRFVVTSMQENALHGWKLADGKHMRMSGYPAKVKSLSWAPKGKWLASSGAPAAIVWPFQGRDGPMGKAPLELGTRGNTLVTCVACHPSQDVVAIGYEDGMVIAARFADAREVLLRRPGKGAITAMMWDREERRVAFGSAAGDCGVIDIAG